MALRISVALASATLIAFQLVIMQMLSVSQWHHFAYMVISMAMLGFGAAGTVLALFRSWLKTHADRVLAPLFLLSALSMASGSTLTGLFGEFDAFLLFSDRRQTGLLLFVYLVYCMPFFWGGLAITLVFYDRVQDIGRLYFFNLAGSALGGILVIALFWLVPLSVLPALLALLVAVAALLVWPQHKGWKSVSAGLLALVVPVVVVFAVVRVPELRSSEYKDISYALQLPDARIVYERHSPYGLLQKVQAPALRYAPALSLNYIGEPPVRDVLFNNGSLFGTLAADALVQSSFTSSASAPGTPASSTPDALIPKAVTPSIRDTETSARDSAPPEAVDPSTRDTLASETPNLSTPDTLRTHLLDTSTRGLAYAVRDARRVWVLGAGTGNDAAQALMRGAASVSVVEPHRLATRLLTGRYAHWNDSLFVAPQVHVHSTSVRSWLSRPAEPQPDLVVMPVLGAFGGTSGVYALQERYDLTLQGFEAVWNHLPERGIVAVTLWHESPERGGLRLLATWRELLDRMDGVDADGAENHILAVRGWATSTFLLSRSPFGQQEVARARAFALELGFDPLIAPGLDSRERQQFHFVEDEGYFDRIDTLVHGDPEALYSSYLFDVRPVTDDRPFFHHFMTLGSLGEVHRVYGPAELPYLELGFVLALVTLIQIVLVSVVLVVLPLFRVGWQGTRRRWTFAYFLGTGLGFMFFEMVLIQKLVLYLGEPVYATAAVLSALLLFSGAGSYVSSYIPARRRVVFATGMLVAVLVVGYAVWLMPLLELSMSWPLAGRVLLVGLLLAPPSFFMGMMFPFGLRRLSGSNESQIPWACGVDSCLSVSATALATVVALHSGFYMVMIVASTAYLVTAMAALRIGSDI